MAQGVETRTILAQLEEGFLPPIRVGHVRAAWDTDCTLQGEESGILVQKHLHVFLEGFLDQQKGKADPQELVRILTPALNSMRRASELNVQALVTMATGAEPGAPIDPAALQVTTVNAFTRMNSSLEDRKNLSHSLVACRRAGDFLKSLRNAVEQFVFDSKVLPTSVFKTNTDRERFVKLVCADLDTDMDYLGTLRAELVTLDTRLSDCRDDLHKLLTALRMFTDQGNQNLRINGPQSLPMTGVPSSRIPSFSHSAQPPRARSHG